MGWFLGGGGGARVSSGIKGKRNESGIGLGEELHYFSSVRG